MTPLNETTKISLWSYSLVEKLYETVMVSRDFLYWHLSSYILIAWCHVGTHLGRTRIPQDPGKLGSAEHGGIAAAGSCWSCVC